MTKQRLNQLLLLLIEYELWIQGNDPSADSMHIGASKLIRDHIQNELAIGSIGS